MSCASLELVSPLQVTHISDRRDQRLLASLPKDTGECEVNEIAYTRLNLLFPDPLTSRCSTCD